VQEITDFGAICQRCRSIFKKRIDDNRHEPSLFFMWPIQIKQARPDQFNIELLQSRE